MSRYLLDLAERVAATYAAALLGLLLADGTDLLSVSAWQAAAVAAIPAGLSALKGAVGSLIGDPRTAAWLPRGRS